MNNIIYEYMENKQNKAIYELIDIHDKEHYKVFCYENDLKLNEELSLNELVNELKEIWQYKMVVFNPLETNEGLKNFLKKLKKGFLLENNMKELYYFPQVKYQDIYIIKSLYERVFINDKCKGYFCNCEI